MKSARCNRCHRVAEVPPVMGMQPDLPAAWKILTIHGTPTRNWLICDECIKVVTLLLDSSHMVLATTPERTSWMASGNTWQNAPDGMGVVDEMWDHVRAQLVKAGAVVPDDAEDAADGE